MVVIGAASRPKRSDRVLSQRASDATVLLALDNWRYYEVNDVGARVWECCDGTRSVAEVVTAVAAEYDVTEETVLADVRGLLADMVGEGLLTCE